MDNLNIAVVQFESESQHIESNVEKVIKNVTEVIQLHPNVQLILFPEMCLYGYDRLSQAELSHYEARMKACLKKLTQKLQHYHVLILVGYFTKRNGNFYNTLGLIDSNGNILCEYNKTHLVKGLDQVFTPGNQYVILEIEDFRLGVLICWDAAFSEVTNFYAGNRIDALLVSAAWEHPFENQWEILLKARAVETGKYVFAANLFSQRTQPCFFGNSCIIDNKGEIRAQMNFASDSFLYYELKKTKKDNLFGSPSAEIFLTDYFDSIDLKVIKTNQGGNRDENDQSNHQT